MYDVVIIGAGVTGASVARRLSRYDLKVAILEKENDVSMGASKANSAIIHGGYAEDGKELRGSMCYPGRLEFDKLEEELNFGFLKNGSLVIGFDENDLKVLEKLYKQGIENGLDDISIIEQDEIRRIEPNISDEVKYALYCKGAGVISPYEYVIALCENAVDNSVKLFLETEVLDIRKEEDIFVLKTNKEEFKAKYIVNASGLNGAKISKMIVQTDFSIHPRSGEYLIMQKGTGEKIKTVLFQVPTPKTKGILATRTFHNNILLGPDAIDEEEIDKDTHQERLAEIYTQAQKSVKENVINIKEFIRSFTGLRPASSTGDFIIEASEEENHFINAVGIQSPGLTSSPEVAKRVVKILQQNGLTLIEKEDYNPNRKAIIKYKDLEDFNSIKDKVNYELGNDERIVCRCEQVSEKTLRDALSRSTPVLSFDALKRRTRCGMGFCQGTFCKNRVLEVMEDFYKDKVSYEDFDIIHSGINRVNKKDIIKYIEEYKKEHPEKTTTKVDD